MQIVPGQSENKEVASPNVITIVHEIAHFYGLDDDRLHELGWG